jgi:hypothetical protein
MAISLYAAGLIIRDWCSEAASVRFSWIGRGINFSCLTGTILDVSDNSFTFGSKQSTVVVDLRILPNADFILSDNFKSALPPKTIERLEGHERCALIFKGLAGELAVILK